MIQIIRINYILQKYNLSKYKAWFLNGYFTYEGEKLFKPVKTRCTHEGKKVNL